MDASPLNKLPLELRLTIYEYTLYRIDTEFAICLYNVQPVNKDGILTGKVDVLQRLRGGHQGPDRLSVEKYLLALLLTCRGIAKEARSVVYEINAWSLHGDHILNKQDPAAGPRALRSWLRKRGVRGRRMFRSIAICTWPEHNYHQELDQEGVAKSVYDQYMRWTGCFDKKKTRTCLYTGPALLVGVDVDGLAYESWHAVWLPMKASRMRKLVSAYEKYSRVSLAWSKQHCDAEELWLVHQVEDVARKLTALLWYLVDRVESDAKSMSSGTNSLEELMKATRLCDEISEKLGAHIGQ